MGVRVLSAHVDLSGRASLDAREDLYVNQPYELRVPATEQLEPAHVAFTVGEAANAVELLLSRRTVDIGVQLESSLAGTEHWAAGLLPPAGVLLRLRHRATDQQALVLESDARGRATLRGQGAVFVGEMYTLEAPGGGSVKESCSVDFVASRAAGQQVVLTVDRTTADVTLAVVAARQPTGVAEYAQELGAPSGLRYDVFHKALERHVATGFTDEVGKSVVRRVGTLFVGETYEARVAGGKGIEGGVR
eukprot:6602737-Prymnesium_polylepis.1